MVDLTPLWWHTCYNSLASHDHDGCQGNPKCSGLHKIEQREAGGSFESSCLIICQDFVILLSLKFLVVEVLVVCACVKGGRWGDTFNPSLGNSFMVSIYCELLRLKKLDLKFNTFSSGEEIQTSLQAHTSYSNRLLTQITDLPSLSQSWWESQWTLTQPHYQPCSSVLWTLF